MKSAKKSDADEAGNVSASYVVGQVSGCLFPNKSASGSGSLSALFSASSTTNTVKFVPAPKPEPKPVKGEDTPVIHKAVPVTGSIRETSKKIKKPKSAAELKLQDRESALQNADDDDVRVPNASKASKRKAPNDDDEDEGAAGNNKRPAEGVKSFKDNAAERVKLSRTVFVGNLPVACTKEGLRAIFKEHGAIESIRFRSVVREDPSMSRKVAAIKRKVHPKKQSINAYIVFKEKEGAVSALTRNGMEIQKDFHIRVDTASKQHDHKRSIFVGNLPYDIAELSLRQHFEDCGSVEAVRLIRDRDTGMGKGFGYVLFENLDSVQLALKLDGSRLCERKIRVKRAIKDTDGKPGAAGGEVGKGHGRGKKGYMKEGPRGGPPGKRGGGGGVGRGGKKPFQRNPGKKTPPSTFKGEMATPGAKKHKGQKKKFKPRKKKDNIHI